VGPAAPRRCLRDHHLRRRLPRPQAEAVGQLLAEGLWALSAELGLGEVRGSGLLLALELGDLASERVVVGARERGLLVNGPRPHCLRFMPALNTTAAEVEQGLKLLRRALQDARAAA
jgi:acetylornithine/N-succinyldiaminopimelate aminotransferase